MKDGIVMKPAQSAAGEARALAVQAKAAADQATDAKLLARLAKRRLKEARRRVLGPESVNIQSLEIATAGRTVRLVKHGEVWSLTQPLDWPANPLAVSGIVQDLALLEQKASFNVADLANNKLSLADYGLDKPKLTVVFTSGESGVTTTLPTLGAGAIHGDWPVRLSRVSSVVISIASSSCARADF